ncbi:MAG: preprotein translocase subunit SecG [Clostridia bacterium]|nr:preprotein translocase subunit SecG [Clostridia bacterium]
MYLAFAIILLCAALFLVVAILLQSSKDKGISGTISGGSSETYFGKNKGKSREKKLNTLTIVVAIIFALIVLTVFVIQKEPVQLPTQQ